MSESLRRSKEEILFGILKSCSSEKLTINQLMICQNLSYRQLKSYLEQLVRSSLVTIEMEEKRKLVGTTQDGLNALNRYRGAISILRGHARESSHNIVA